MPRESLSKIANNLQSVPLSFWILCGSFIAVIAVSHYRLDRLEQIYEGHSQHPSHVEDAGAIRELRVLLREHERRLTRHDALHD